MMMELSEFIRRKRLTRAQAAELFGVSQPRISDLVRGKFSLFTIDMLVTMLARAGRKVVVQTKRANANDHRPAHFHAKYGSFEALIEIETGGVIRGHLPPRVLGLVQEWQELHRTELLQDWKLAEDRKPLQRIEPLE